MAITEGQKDFINGVISCEFDLPNIEVHLREEIKKILEAIREQHKGDYESFSKVFQNPSLIARIEEYGFPDKPLTIGESREYMVEYVESLIIHASGLVSKSPRDLGWNQDEVLQDIRDRSDHDTRLVTQYEVEHTVGFDQIPDIEEYRQSIELHTRIIIFEELDSMLQSRGVYRTYNGPWGFLGTWQNFDMMTPINLKYNILSELRGILSQERQVLANNFSSEATISSEWQSEIAQELRDDISQVLGVLTSQSLASMPEIEQSSEFSEIDQNRYRNSILQILGGAVFQALSSSLSNTLRITQQEKEMMLQELGDMICQLCLYSPDNNTNPGYINLGPAQSEWQMVARNILYSLFEPQHSNAFDQTGSVLSNRFVLWGSVRQAQYTPLQYSILRSLFTQPGYTVNPQLSELSVANDATDEDNDRGFQSFRP